MALVIFLFWERSGEGGKQKDLGVTGDLEHRGAGALERADRVHLNGSASTCKAALWAVPTCQEKQAQQP